jgi:hypothetical protein
MDVIESLDNENRFEDLSLVTVAMGLTPAEAERTGIATE